MKYNWEHITWDNYYGYLCKAYDRHDFAEIAAIVKELHERYKEKVKHLGDDIKQMSQTIKHLNAELSER